MNLDLQAHFTNLTFGKNSKVTYTGMAWSRGEILETVEYSTDDGQTWHEVSYEVIEGELSSYETFEFMFTINREILPLGTNMVIIRAIDDSGASSLIDWEQVEGGGNVDAMAGESSLGRIVFLSIFALAVALFGVFVFIQKRVDEPHELISSSNIPSVVYNQPLDAEIIDD